MGISIVFTCPIVFVLIYWFMWSQLFKPSFIIVVSPVSLSLINTLDVICIAFTKQRPSLIPLFRTIFSTCDVMFTNPLLEDTFNVRYSVTEFITVKIHICDKYLVQAQNSRSFSSNQRDLVINACNI